VSIARRLGRGKRAVNNIGAIEDYLAATYAYGGGTLGGIPAMQQTLGGRSTELIPADYVGHALGGFRRNSVIFSCMLVRQLVFSAIRFQWQRFNNGRPSEMFGSSALSFLERPWPGGTTQDLLNRTIQSADLAGNAYWTTVDGEAVGMRPDWLQVLLLPRQVPGTLNEDGVRPPAMLSWKKVGYLYTEDGVNSGQEPVYLDASRVSHYAPIPDPLANYRGMSWLTPVIREVAGDESMTEHKRRFFDNGATGNIIVTHPETADIDTVKRFASELEDSLRRPVTDAVFRTLHVGGGADATVVGANLAEVEFSATQGHGETRIAAAAGVPPVIVGLSEGLQAATYCGTYNEAVWTTRGIVKLGEILPGDAVWSLVDGRLEPRKVTWHAPTGTKPVYTIRTRNRTVTFTDNHPVLVRVPGNSAGGNVSRAPGIEWRRVDQLRVGDKVVQARHLPDQGLGMLPTGAPATVDAMQWLGAYTGDGCLSGDGTVRMCIPVDDRARPHYEALAGRLFLRHSTPRHDRRAQDGLTDEMVRLRGEGLTYRQIVDRMGLALHPMSVRDRVATATREYGPTDVPVPTSPARNGFQLHSKHAVAWHHRMGVTGTASTKRVPGWVYELREDLRLAYLAGIVDTDGSVGVDGRLSVQFANRDLAEDVRMLLISCGIACSNLGEVTYTAAVLPNPGLRDTYRAWRFVASSAVEVATIPFADHVYRERVVANQHRHRPAGGDAAKAGLSDDLGFYTIRSIDVGPAEPVYDIEVEGGHSFLADGVVVHNSNYAQARRRFADGTMHPLWQNVAGTFEQMMGIPPAGVRLWYDTRDVPFLREDEKDAAQIALTQAQTMAQLVNSGYEPTSVSRAVLSGDFGLLTHTGFFSVQLRPPGEMVPPIGTPPPVQGAASTNGQQPAAV
jgi:hypothetical protein